MANKNTELPNIEKLEKSPQMSVATFPQILKEMEGNIRAVIDAVKIN
ncbi:hypothetical protein ACFLTK_01275 [Chloroflexota bacterium]